MKKFTLPLFLTLIITNNPSTAMQSMDKEDGELSQLTQPMETFPDFERSIELENAIKEGMRGTIAKLIMDGVVIDPKTKENAIQSYGQAAFKLTGDSDEGQIELANIKKYEAIEQVRAVIRAAENARAYRDASLESLHDHLTFMPATVVDIIIGYKP